MRGYRVRAHTAVMASGIALAVLGSVLPVAAQRTSPKRVVAKAPRKTVTNASWYGRRFKDRTTASGIPFHPNNLIAAHPTLPLGSHVRVTDMIAGRSVVVKIVDRGPFMVGRGIDLSYAAARRLGMVERGVARVSVEVVADPAKPPLLVALVPQANYPLPGAIVQ